MKPIVGSVPYLNAKPLVAWFETEAGSSELDVTFDVPSVLAEQLRRRTIAAGMLSSFESFRRADTVIVPGVSISDFGEVKSVRLFSKKPIQEIETVALDTSSLTSNALLQIVLQEQFGVQPLFAHRPPQLDAMLNEFDAGLLIGDPGMFTPDDGLHTLDLGEAWSELTGLPFVWAVWLANEEQVTTAMVAALQEAKAYGTARIEAIAAREADRLGRPVEVCLDYLKNVMDYGLTERHLAGLRQYQALCLKHGLIEEALPLRLAEPLRA